MSELLVIVPSRGRPANVARLIQAFTDTGAWGVADLRIDIDADDPAHDAYMALELPEGARVAVGHRWRPAMFKLNRAARQEVDTYYALGFMGDDHVPETVGWAQRILEALRDMGSGIVYGDDGLRGESLPTQWMMTTDIVRILGNRLSVAPVDHLYCDNAVLDLGRAADCIRYLPDVVIRHHHYIAGLAPRDEQYARVNGPEQYRHDGATYRRWLRSRERAEHVAAVRELASAARGHGTSVEPARAAVTAPTLLRVGPKVVATYARRDEPQELVDDLRANLPWVDDLIELQVPREGGWTHEGQRHAQQRELIRHAHGEVWTLWLDPDERLEDGAGDKLRAVLADAARGTAFGLTLREMWTPTAYRVDGAWGSKKPRWRVYHLHDGQTFTVDRPIHCLPTPRGGKRVPLDINLYHLKHVEPANRAARAEAFLAADPAGRYQPHAGDWSHLTDETGLELVEVPADRQFSPPYRAGSYLFTPPR